MSCENPADFSQPQDYGMQQKQQQPPPQGYSAPPLPPGYVQQGGTVVLTQPGHGFETGIQYGKSPMAVECKHCHSSVTTNTKKKCGLMPWAICGMICLIGLSFPLFWLGCQFIPFCIPALYDVEHSCPSCQEVVGSNRPGRQSQL